MSNIVFNSSDDNVVEGTVTINSSSNTITTGSTVIAFVMDVDKTIKIIDDITINESDDGNDWANGIIKGYFTKVESAALAAYDNLPVLVCVQITISGFTETFTEIVIASKML